MDLIHKPLRRGNLAKLQAHLGINAEVLKAAGEVGIQLLTELSELVCYNGYIPKD